MSVLGFDDTSWNYDETNDENSDGTSFAGGAPWGVTDFKAAIRYLRYNSELLPGDETKIITFGHSGGGAQSALLGVTGDNELYYPYLVSIGAAMYDDEGNLISDATYGAMSWCPITNLDSANMAYEWQMGQFSSSGTRSDDTWTSALSDDLSKKFADYINAVNLKDENGNVLTLEESSEGIYLAGTYYDYLMAVINESLNNFLSDTTFPYTPSSSEQADGGFAGGSALPAVRLPLQVQHRLQAVPRKQRLLPKQQLPLMKPLRIILTL